MQKPPDLLPSILIILILVISPLDSHGGYEYKNSSITGTPETLDISGTFNLKIAPVISEPGIQFLLYVTVDQQPMKVLSMMGENHTFTKIIVDEHLMFKLVNNTTKDMKIYNYEVTEQSITLAQIVEQYTLVLQIVGGIVGILLTIVTIYLLLERRVIHSLIQNIRKSRLRSRNKTLPSATQIPNQSKNSRKPTNRRSRKVQVPQGFSWDTEEVVMTKLGMTHKDELLQYLSHQGIEFRQLQVIMRASERFRSIDTCEQHTLKQLYTRCEALILHPDFERIREYFDFDYVDHLDKFEDETEFIELMENRISLEHIDEFKQGKKDNTWQAEGFPSLLRYVIYHSAISRTQLKHELDDILKGGTMLGGVSVYEKLKLYFTVGRPDKNEITKNAKKHGKLFDDYIEMKYGAVIKVLKLKAY